ncbi:uncharacterized protein [Brachionichthys hirsutus]|uniref:uncharacterized protein n=1 Tax=Brachionichthys hirsutus TaxID=412623 RepID=UPI0036048D3A
MAVLSSRALHEQLGLIMDALTKAAVAEICELVGGAYAVLRREVSRRREENDDLRKKLHLIESIVVRGNGGQAEAAPEPEGARRADSDAGAPAGVPREELPDVVLIKDEDSDSNHSCGGDSRAPADGGMGGARGAAVSRRRKRRRSGPEASDQPSAGTQTIVNVYTLDSPPGQTGRSSRLDGEEGEDIEAYASQMDRDVPLVPQGARRQPSYYSGGAVAESPPSPAWTKPDEAQAPFARFHQNENPDDAFGLKLISVSGSASLDSQMSEGSNSAFEYDNGDALNYGLCGGGGGARGKRFVCSVCGRTYATAQNLDVHLRIHTGERPFSCEQCGKRFTQSAHLKSHLSVHSGERPFTCTLCGRSFIVKYSLKLHMKKCHPNAQSE